MTDYKCKHCGRDAREIGTEHFVDESDDRVVCEECAAKQNPIAIQPTEEQPILPTAIQKPVDVSSFQGAAFELLCERVRQIAELGYTPEHDSRHTLAEFLTYIEGYINLAKHRVALRNPQETANARADMIKIGALVCAYLESRPLPRGQ